MKLIGLACAVGVILVSGGCAENLTAPPAAGPDHVVIHGSAHVEGGVPLFVVDGRVLKDDAEVQRIDPAQIQNVEVLKGQAAVDRFGAPGANGVILITLKRAG
ncbi:MAG: TonB-dependent receptor plug domain-containing protein [Longimicrobiaceae bacterium]